MNRTQKTLILGTVSALLAGCSSAVRLAPENLPKVAVPVIAEGDYKIQIGDELSIKFFYNRELNEDVVVRPDGRISLQLIPEVAASGLTPAALADVLRGLYSTEMDNPEIAVIVRTFSSQRIYVDGEVRRQGEYPLIGPTTLLQAIARAGGAMDTAQLKNVFVIRRGKEGQPFVIQANVKATRDGKDNTQDIGLQPYDVVYVPKSDIANVNKWVDQYIRQNIPVSFGFRIEF